MSRPRILDDLKRCDINALIAAGVGLDAAARYAGCSVSTIRREAMRNEDFARELRVSESRAQLDPLNSMRDAARTHWRAAAWLLERANPRQFGRRKLDGCSPQEFHDVIDAIVRQACEEIAEPELRERVCRRLFAAAYRASRALANEQHARLHGRGNGGNASSVAEPSPVDELVAELRSSRTRAAASCGQFTQNPELPPRAA